MEIYISLVNDLVRDREALRILKESGIVSGIETSDIDEQVEMVKDAGLKFSSHKSEVILSNPNCADLFDSRLLDVIINSDAPTIGFHCGYSAERIYKFRGFPNVPIPNTLITDKDNLLKKITDNIVLIENKINQNLQKNKQVVVESLDYSREKPIPWDQQIDEIKNNKKEIEEIVVKYGINAGILYVTEPSFIKKVLDKTKTGFLFDIGHVFISADAKKYKGEFKGAIEDYFDEMLKVSNGRTYQMHLTVPEGNDKEGYSDYHCIFTPGERLSDHIIELTQEVVKKSPELSVLTLEMKTNFKPVEHAKEMIKQAEYVIKKLNI